MYEKPWGLEKGKSPICLIRHGTYTKFLKGVWTMGKNLGIRLKGNKVGHKVG